MYPIKIGSWQTAPNGISELDIDNIYKISARTGTIVRLCSYSL